MIGAVVTLVVPVAVLCAASRGVCRAAGVTAWGPALSLPLALLSLAPLLPVPLAAAPALVAVGAVVVAALVRAPLLSTFALPSSPWPRGDLSAALAKATLALFVLLALHVVWSTWIWDEASTHAPLASAVMREVKPLVHPAWPSQELRYHVGFPMLAGLVGAHVGVGVSAALDVTSTLCLLVLVVVLLNAGALVAPRWAFLAPVVALCAWGPAAACLADGWGAPVVVCREFLPEAWVNGATFPPLPLTSFFQHPQGLAMPLSLSALVLGAHRGRLAFALAALLCAATAHAQVVFFALSGASLFAQALVHAARDRSVVDTLMRGALLALAAGLGISHSGLLSSGAGAAALAWGGYFDASASVVVRELLAFGWSLGAPLVACVLLWRRPAGDAVARALTVALAVAAVCGFAVANALHYPRSWDIVKFFSVGGFFGGLLVLQQAACLWPRARVLTTLLLVVSLWSGLFWLVRHGPGNGVLAYAEVGQGPSRAARAFIAACGDRIDPHARVLTPDDGLAQVGLLVVGGNWRKDRDTQALLLDRARADEEQRQRAAALVTLDASALRALDVQVVVLPASRPVLGGATVLCEAGGLRAYDAAAVAR